MALSPTGVAAVAANANGIIAVGHAHFADCVKLYDPNFNLLATVTGFNGSNYDAPADVEVGASGNFYGLDQWNNRIFCISGQSGNYGQILATYSYPSQAGRRPLLSRLRSDKTL